jgi:hypothetical protein
MLTVAARCRQTTVDVLSAEGYSDKLTFHFDRIFGFSATQQEVYETVAKPVVDGLFEGFNGTIFAYGQVRAGTARVAVVPHVVARFRCT